MDRKPSAGPRRARWIDAVLVHAVRGIEQDDGTLDDAAAMRRAATACRGRDDRIVERARALAEAIGLERELTRWRTVAPWVAVVLVLVMGLVAAGVVGAAIGQDRRVNAIAALIAVLGLPTASLGLWIIGLAWRYPPAGGGVSAWALALGTRLPGWRTPHGARLARIALELLARERLLPWVLGGLNHLLWLAALLLVLAGLLWAFAFRAYVLTWETTILPAEFFAALVDTSGWLPARLGFAVPDTAAALSASLPSADPRPWAWWLVGCTVVYGVAPRVLAAGVCALVWVRRRERLLAIDTSQPYFRELAARFERWDAAQVIDVERAVAVAEPHAQRPALTDGDTVAVIGFELGDGVSWPIAELGDARGWNVAVGGTAAQRREVHDRIARTRPGRVLIVVDAVVTPDRGTERFIREALAGGAQGGLLLLGDDVSHRWRDWRGRCGLDRLAVFADIAEARAWVRGDAGG